MTDTKSEAREFWIDISDCEDDDALPSIAYEEHPKQGPLPWQEKLVHVIQFSAHQDLKAKHERLLEALIEKTKRSNYEWFEGYAYSPDEWVNEGQIACALEILSKVEKTEGLKK